MPYAKQSWADDPSGGTPVSAARLTHIEDGIAAAASLVFNVVDYGAVGDGATDDSGAFALALAAATGAGGGQVLVPARTFRLVMTARRTALTVGAGTRVTGTPGASRLLIDTDDLTGFRSAFVNGGDNVTLQGLTMTRARDFPCVLLPVGPHERFRVLECFLDGRRDVLDHQYCHGLELGAAGTTTDLQLRSCTLTRLDYGLFQSNSATGTVIGVSVDHCTLTANHADDLEFNAPAATMTDVSVTGCRFTDNRSLRTGAGFAIGFAHVTRGLVSGCTFGGYANEALHLEDWTSGVVVTANRFLRCGTAWGGYVVILSGTFSCQFLGNVLDASRNGNSGLTVFTCTAGGTGLTAGGRPVVAPSGCTISDNSIAVGEHYGAIYAGGTAFSIHHNAGINPVGRIAAPPVPASGQALANDSGFDVTAYLVGGTVTAVAVGGVTTGITAGAVRVAAGQTVAVSYGTPPDWTWIGD